MIVEANPEKDNTENINYEAINEAFGDADVSDEEDAIQNENDDTKSGKTK